MSDRRRKKDDEKVDRRRDARAAKRDVGSPPKPTPYWRARRKKCAESLLEFCRTFLPQKFYLPFSGDHLRVISKLERIVRHGGLLSLAMPRGSGKSECVKAAALWAILNGYRRFVVVIGATSGDAVRVMADIKAQLAHNDRVHAGFPEATHCVRALKGIVHKAKVQTIDGEPSGLEWSKEAIRLAFVPDAPCSGAVFRTAGLTGAIRGMSATGPSGESIRPDLVLLDDPQDREAATSPVQTDDRERIVRGDVLGLAGPNRKIAVAMPCTVICENDLADRFLDRQRSPQWQGERTRLVVSFPHCEELWESYFKLRDDDLRAGGDGRVATEFYRRHRSEMDAGGEVAWPERFDAEWYASALEEAMVRRHDDPEAFAAECQNEPVRAEATRGETRQLRPAELAGRVCHVPRGVVPGAATRLTAFVDLGHLLWWGVCGWSERFDGWLVDYGSFPQQPRPYYTSDDAHPKLRDRFPGRTEEQQVFAGLQAVTAEILGRDYLRDDGTPMTVQHCLVDSGWLPGVVHQVRAESPYRDRIVPSVGHSTAGMVKAMDEWVRRPTDERTGPSWRYGPPPSGRGRRVVFDPDFWKSFAADRLSTPPGSGGAIQFFGDSPAEHRLLCDHLTAEYSVRVTVRSRTFDKWERKPGGGENHLLDVLVGNCLAASFGNLAWNPAPDGTPPAPRAPRQKVRLSDLYYQKNGGRPGARA